MMTDFKEKDYIISRNMSVIALVSHVRTGIWPVGRIILWHIDWEKPPGDMYYITGKHWNLLARSNTAKASARERYGFKDE